MLGSSIGHNTSDTKDLRQCWRTPSKLFDDLHKIFNFTIDACASKDNALLPRYWSIDNDARLQDWSEEIVFCNPPYGKIATFLIKAPTAKSCYFYYR